MSSSDNVTNAGVWHFSGSTEANASINWHYVGTSYGVGDFGFGAAASGLWAQSFSPGGLADQTWTIDAVASDLAGNTSAHSVLAVVYDGTAPATPLLDLLAAEDSGVSSSDNVTNAGVWHFSGSTEANASINWHYVGTSYGVGDFGFGAAASGLWAQSFSPGGLADQTWTIGRGRF